MNRYALSYLRMWVMIDTSPTKPNALISAHSDAYLGQRPLYRNEASVATTLQPLQLNSTSLLSTQLVVLVSDQSHNQVWLSTTWQKTTNQDRQLRLLDHQQCLRRLN